MFWGGAGHSYEQNTVLIRVRGHVSARCGTWRHAPGRFSAEGDRGVRAPSLFRSLKTSQRTSCGRPRPPCRHPPSPTPYSNTSGDGNIGTSLMPNLHPARGARRATSSAVKADAGTVYSQGPTN